MNLYYYFASHDQTNNDEALIHYWLMQANFLSAVLITIPQDRTLTIFFVLMLRAQDEIAKSSAFFLFCCPTLVQFTFVT